MLGSRLFSIFPVILFEILIHPIRLQLTRLPRSERNIWSNRRSTHRLVADWPSPVNSGFWRWFLTPPVRLHTPKNWIFFIFPQSKLNSYIANCMPIFYSILISLIRLQFGGFKHKQTENLRFLIPKNLDLITFKAFKCKMSASNEFLASI